MKMREISPPQIGPDSLRVELRLDQDLFWFQGHFAVQPVLPGVAQLDWVMQYAALLAPGFRFSGIQSVKFQAPLLPENRVVLELAWREEKQLLTFSYRRRDGDASYPASSGKIQLCR